MVSSTSEPPVTRELAAFIAASRWEDLPDTVRHESRRALLNVLGCAIGGSTDPIVGTARAALAEFAGPPQATLIGLNDRGNVLHASFINCLSSSVDSFDDNHAEVIVHPSGPVAFPLLALAERTPVSGAAFLHAFALGVETVCRISKAISMPPAAGNLGWVQTGIVGGIGAAVAAGKLLGLDAQKLAWAMGIAGSQAAGYRANQGTMCTPLMPAHAARSGLEAALLAERGYTSSEATLEARYGYCSVFAERFNLAVITDGLGRSFDLLGITYKPYPSGVVLNPIIEACLGVHSQHAVDQQAVESIHVRAHPTAVAITDRRHPPDPMAAQLSLQHWAAVAIAFGTATTEELSMRRIADPVVVRLRDRVEATADAGVAQDAAEVVVTLRNGQTVSQRVEHCIGSAGRPMTDGDIEQKFRGLTNGVVADSATSRLLDLCWRIDALDDVTAIARAAA